MNLYDRNQRVRNFFNERITEYDEVHQKYMNTKRALADNLDKNTKRILDLGAGTGLELIHLFEVYPDVSVTVIDITENMLEKLKTRSFASKVETICGDFFKVDFGKDYDAVISTSALHHFKIEEKIKLYRKIYECLKQNGVFLNSDYIALTEEIQKEQLDKLENHFDEYKHIDIPITVDNEVKILTQTGFKDISVNEVDVESYRLIKARKY